MYVRLLLGLLCVLGCATLVDASPFAYVANYRGNYVTRIDLSKTTGNTTDIQLPGASGPYGVAVNAFGSRVYVSSREAYIVSVIDTSDDSVTSFGLSFKPGALAVNSAGTRLYVSDPDHDSVAVLNAVDGTVIKTVTVGTPPLMINPQGIVVSGNKVYVASSPHVNIGTTESPIYKDAIQIFDANLDSMTQLGSIQVDTLPMGLAINSAGDRLYVACSQGNTLNKIDLSTQTPTVTVIPGAGQPGVTMTEPIGVALSPDGSKAYVTLAKEDKIAVVNTQTNTVDSQKISVGRSPMGISIVPDGSRIVAANADGASASVVNPATNTVVATSTVGDRPESVGNFVGPELFAIEFPIPYNGTMVPTAPITIDPYTYIALAAKAKDFDLTVTPDTNFTVGNVYVDGNPITPPYKIPNVTGPHTLSVDYTRVTRTVTLVKNPDLQPYEVPGTGRVWTTDATPVIDCGTTCNGASANYSLTSTVTFNAVADPGSTFQGWQGSNCQGTAPCSIIVNNPLVYDPITGNHTINALFRKSTTTTLQGAYDSAADGGSIDCSASYSEETGKSFIADLAKTVTLKPASPSTTLDLTNASKKFTVQSGKSTGGIIIGAGGTLIIK